MQVDERTFRKMIKAKARVTLFRRPGFALLAGLYTFLPMMLFALVLQLIAQAEWGVGLRLAALGAAALAYLLVLSPLTMGNTRSSVCCRGQGVAPLGELFAYSSGWKGYVRALQMTALTEGMTVLWSLLFFSAGRLLFVLYHHPAGRDGGAAVLVAVPAGVWLDHGLHPAADLSGVHDLGGGQPQHPPHDGAAHRPDAVPGTVPAQMPVLYQLSGLGCAFAGHRRHRHHCL